MIDLVRRKYSDMWLNGFFIVGFPIETREDILATLRFSGELDLDWASHYIFKPFPGTELYQDCVDRGLIEAFDFGYGENYSESPIDGPDWDRGWAFDTNYEYNLRVNFLNNRNLANGNHAQALRDFEYIIAITSDHALAYRQAAVAARGLDDIEKAARYESAERRILSQNGEFAQWYAKLEIPIPRLVA